jgi:hypothetical protein
VGAVVELRGQLQTSHHINRPFDQVRVLPGVRHVRSFLHLLDTPAPSKQEAPGPDGRQLHDELPWCDLTPRVSLTESRPPRGVDASVK